MNHWSVLVRYFRKSGELIIVVELNKFFFIMTLDQNISTSDRINCRLNDIKSITNEIFSGNNFFRNVCVPAELSDQIDRESCDLLTMDLGTQSIDFSAHSVRNGLGNG